MIDEEHDESRTQERGTQSVPRFIVALGVVGVVALVAAAVGVALTYEPSTGGKAQVTESVETTDQAAPFTQAGDAAIPEEPPVVEEFEVAADGPSAAELAAQAGSEAEGTDDITPAKEGEELPTLSAMPKNTLGLIALDDSFESARFEATFSPYGWGPGGRECCNLVIIVREVQSLDGDTDGLTDLAGKNVSVWIDPADLESLGSGGEFEGIIEVRRQGNVGALFLAEISQS